MDLSLWGEHLGSYVKMAAECGILTILIYLVLYYLRGTRGIYVLAGLIMIFLGLIVISQKLQFTVISDLMNSSLTILAIAVVVIFQPELRRAFAQLGSYAFFRGGRRRALIGEIAVAAVAMSRRKCGALIVVERRIKMQAIVEDSVRLDAAVNSLLLESIFYPNSPLHDGAVVVREDRIIAARAILPLTRVENVLRSWGTRHRAAIGISEETDAVTIVVSEESGILSVASHGLIRRRIPADLLETYLEGVLLHDRSDADVARELGLPDRVATVQVDDCDFLYRSLHSEEKGNKK